MVEQFSFVILRALGGNHLFLTTTGTKEGSTIVNTFCVSSAGASRSGEEWENGTEGYIGALFRASQPHP